MSAPPLAAALGLAPHPEGGWFRETWRSGLTLPADALPDHDGPRAAGTAIYFLLGPDERSAWHRVRSAELCRVWQSARPAVDREVLVSCVVVPGFDFADFTLA